MTKQSTRDEALDRYLKSSGVYSENDGVRHRITYGERQTYAEMLDDDVVRVSMGTGVYATPETELSLRAVCNHLDGWVYKIGSFGVSDSREIVFYSDRNIATHEEKASLMLRRLDFSIDDAMPHLKRAAEGFQPSESIKSDMQIEAGRLLLNELLEESGLLGSLAAGDE